MQQGASTDIRKPEVLRGSRIMAEIKASGIEFVISVPDITTSEGLLRPLSQAATPRTALIESRRPVCWISSSARRPV